MSKGYRSLAVTYGDERLKFMVEPSASREKSIRIDVASPEGIKVIAPLDASDQEIRAAVRRRAKWIWKHFHAHKESPKRPASVSGDEILYLGRRYSLKIEEGADASVKLKGSRLVVTTPERDASVIQRAVDHWYRSRGTEYFAKRIAVLFSSISNDNTSLPEFSLRVMRRQWGSCSPAGRLLLNPALVRAPRSCIDYVIAHELCHLRYHHHGPDFYRLLTLMMPDWQSRKDFLELVADQVLV